MNGIPVPGSPPPRGLLGLLSSWMHAWSGQARPSSEAPATDNAGPQAPSGAAVRVLVVDDNPVNLMLISALMEPRGLVPVLAADGAEAVALACELDFDLILMDLQMPILDGLAAASAIRRFERAVARPAVPLVAYSNTSPDAGVLARHGMNGSLSKPCDDHALEDCLRRWCPGYRSDAGMRGPAHDS